MPEESQWFGTFGVRNLSITEDPAIRKLAELPVSARNESGAVVISQSVRAGEASFDRLDLRFSRNGEIIKVEEGLMQGAVVGGTVTGEVDLSQRTLALTGTYVPVFALNNLFSKIPLLGFALGGGSDEGLFGVTYRLAGPISAPQLSVNPVSAIAPGIFRKMFEFR
ncbi:AsmA-like C-terminal region-containing protein [Pannonibacter sp. Pt2-lr]